jgi:mercuric ion transport protein
MPGVELVYDADCPNVAGARAQLMRGFSKARVQAEWQEWNVTEPDTPSHVRGYGSPTILVDGRDVAGAVPAEGGACCRVYEHPGKGLRGLPSLEDIVGALREANGTERPAETRGDGGRWKASSATLPAVGMSLLPKVACPACWPAYAGLLGSVGLGFLLDTAYLLPLTVTFLAIAVAALAFRARGRRGHGPFFLGLAAAVVVLVGKFVLENDVVMYGSLALLIAASVWNGWPRGQLTAGQTRVAGDITLQA